MKLKLIICSLLLSCLTGMAGPRLPVPEHIQPFLTDLHFKVPDDLVFPAEISGILNAEALAHGKRVRPLLCFLAGGMLGLAPIELANLACSVEFVHNASLIHDDVIDASTHRRDNPSLWAQTSVKQAVTIGDWLLAEAVKLVDRPNGSPHVSRILGVIQEMTRGEVRQAKLLQTGTYGLEDWKAVANSKTGVLFGWALSAPAVELGMDAHTIEKYNELGLVMGQVFQAQDDIQDSFDERGELNLALLLAARHIGVSPLSPTLSEEALKVGRQGAAKFIRMQAVQLQRIMAELIASSTAWWRDHGKNRSWEQRDICITGLAVLGRFFTSPPPRLD
jgi:hypothetical protein